MDNADTEDAYPLLEVACSGRDETLPVPHLGADRDEARSDTTFRNTRRLFYISHFLSTWNSRLFEFASYLFLAQMYPGTLLPASVYALSRAGSAAVLSPLVGRYVDRGDRLQVVRVSIGKQILDWATLMSQRVAVAFSCVLLLLMLHVDILRVRTIYSLLMLACLCVLAVAEKLGSVLNTIAVERDWVVVIAEDDDERLRTLNSQMRRIDLFCKLVGPLAISFVDAASSEIAIITTGAMTVGSVAFEYFAIAKVYQAVPGLREEKTTPETGSFMSAQKQTTWRWFSDACKNTMIYFTHPAFLPSFALALLYLTVLSFNAQMITYLLALGVSSGVIGILRGISAVFELSATWLAPKIMKYIGTVRAGIWFLNYQILCVIVACSFLWLDFSPIITVGGTVSAVIASRIGLWGFDLSAQIIIQEEVEADLRGSFSSQEFAFQNIFEMLSFASTIVFAKPEQFKYPATISAAAVGTAAVLYATFVRARRGHLVHLSRCMDREHRRKHGWGRVAQEEEVADHELEAR